MRRSLDACARLSGGLRGPTRHISQWAEISHGAADAAAGGALASPLIVDVDALK